MISFETNVPKISKDIADIIRLFYSFEKILVNEEVIADKKIMHNHIETNGSWQEKTEILINGESKQFLQEYSPPVKMDEIEYMRHLKRSAMIAMYFAIKDATGKKKSVGSVNRNTPDAFLQDA